MAVRQAVRQTICMYLYVGPPKNFACGATSPGGQPPGPPVVRQASQTPNRSPDPVAHSATIAILCCVFALCTVVTEILCCQNQYRIRIQW